MASSAQFLLKIQPDGAIRQTPSLYDPYVPEDAWLSSGSGFCSSISVIFIPLLRIRCLFRSASPALHPE